MGTASVRRAEFLRSKRPDVSIVPFRGNVQTRIEKVRAGAQIEGRNVGCTFLAMAGMSRLGIAHEADVILEPEVMLPAAGQGAVGIEMREGDEVISAIFSHISVGKTVVCTKAEREVLRVLDGTCHTPIGAYAVLDGDNMWLRGRFVSDVSGQIFDDEARGVVRNVDEAIALGNAMGMRLKSKML